MDELLNKLIYSCPQTEREVLLQLFEALVLRLNVVSYTRLTIKQL